MCPAGAVLCDEGWCHWLGVGVKVAAESESPMVAHAASAACRQFGAPGADTRSTTSVLGEVGRVDGVGSTSTRVAAGGGGAGA